VLHRLAILCCAFLLASCAAAPAKIPPGEQLRALVEAHYDEMLELNPLQATFTGDHRFDDRLGDPASPAHEAAMLDLERRYLEAARRIDPARLDGQDRLTWDIFVRARERSLAAARFPARLLPVTQQYSLPLVLAILGGGGSAQPFATVADHERWLARAAEAPRAIDSTIAALREGMARGVTQPREVLASIVPQLDSLIAEDPEKSLFFGPVRGLPESVPAAERAVLEARYRNLIADTLNPSFAKLRDFIRDEYLPACRETVGWSDLPDGAAWYDFLVAVNTTTDMTAAEIHALGLAEVARIRGEMEQVARQVGFEGSLADFFRWVQEEPSFYFDDPRGLIDGYGEIKRRIDSALPRLFRDFPRADYEVRPVEPFRAATAAGASYLSAAPDGSRPGIFYVNTFNLKAQPKFGMETLSLHEASPGHHFQISMAQELTDLPRFRRFSSYVAYVEGWALYAESLGRELGLFTDPMQWYGRLSDEMLRAMRLVVDTGLHAKGWSREQAIQYMRDNSSLAGTDIVAEVDRYIVMPGQALGYKVGDLRIQALRREAEAALGERFDIREFHSQVLRDGALPIDVLEAKVRRWIGEVAARS
jgi:uncharacterized protein (DUF885 family)